MLPKTLKLNGTHFFGQLLYSRKFYKFLILKVYSSKDSITSIFFGFFLISFS